jgi:deazaflavin-dependent oxidoreductase (nitroreductase family)
MPDAFQKPGSIERFFNQLFAALVRRGIGPGSARVLEVRGRKSGKLYSAVVFVLEREGKRYLVAPRGATQWARNAAASGQVTLRRGSAGGDFTVTPVPPTDRAPILRDYLARYYAEVRRFMSVAKDAPLEAFAAIADQHPVFELTPRQS